MKRTKPEIDLLRSGKPTFRLSLYMQHGDDGECLAMTELSDKKIVTLDELENVFRERESRAGAQLVLVTMQIEERDVRTLKPRLQCAGVNLSEHVRRLIRADVPHQAGAQP